MYEPSETAYLRRRIAKLEEENERLRVESSQYLSNWIAAQDLASWRQVLVLARSIPHPEKESTPCKP